MATLYVRNKESVRDESGRYLRRKYDIIQVDPDHAPAGWMSTSRGRDQAYAKGEFIHLRVHVPGYSPAVKAILEVPVTEIEGMQVGEFPNWRTKLIHRHPYYLAHDRLPDWAQYSLELHGEVTLPPAIAADVVRRRTDDQPEPELFNVVHT